MQCLSTCITESSKLTNKSHMNGKKRNISQYKTIHNIDGWHQFRGWISSTVVCMNRDTYSKQFIYVSFTPKNFWSIINPFLYLAPLITEFSLYIFLPLPCFIHSFKLIGKFVHLSNPFSSTIYLLAYKTLFYMSNYPAFTLISQLHCISRLPFISCNKV